MSTDGTTGGHPDLGTLAEELEGLLPEDQRAAVRAHVADCASCAARRGELTALPARLAGAGDVGPVPGDVAHRVHEALATASVVPLPTPQRTPWGMRVLQAAAVVVLLLAGVGLAASVLRAGGGADTSTSAGKAAGEDQAGAADGSYPVTSSGRNWSAATIVAAVPDLVAARLGPSVTRGSTDESAGGPVTMSDAPGDTARLADGVPLAECVAALADGPVTPLAVDLATWQGEPAAVIVLPTPQDAATVDTWVVRPSCGTADAGVLYFARVSRP